MTAVMKQVHERAGKYEDKGKEPEQVCPMLRDQKETRHAQESQPHPTVPGEQPRPAKSLVPMSVICVHDSSRFDLPGMPILEVHPVPIPLAGATQLDRDSEWISAWH